MNVRISETDLKKTPGSQVFSRPWSLNFSKFEVLSFTSGWMNTILANVGMEINLTWWFSSSLPSLTGPRELVSYYLAWIAAHRVIIDDGGIPCMVAL